MKKVLLVSDSLEHYRIPLFNMLCDSIHLTVACSKHNHSISKLFSEQRIKVNRLGPFITYQDLPDFNSFDIVILPFNIRCLELWRQAFRKRKYLVFVFGIGVAASYGKRYDQKGSVNVLRKYILRTIDFAIFYERYPYVKYVAQGVKPMKMSVAYNTVVADVNFKFDKKEYTCFIFIGALYKQKKIFDLLEAYLIAYNKSNQLLQPLEIIGNGGEFAAIKGWVLKNGLEDKVILHGNINEDSLLLPIFNRAIACISPGQAGLSVQKCFSYGVPFVTAANAITGGETFSVIHGVNGYIFDSSIVDLSNILLTFADEKKTVELSKNAHLFYTNFRNVDIWKRGFLKNMI